MSESNKELVASVNELKQTLGGMTRRSESVVIFIDNTNLNLTVRRVDTQGQFRLCYKKLTEHLTAGRTLQQCRIYYSDHSRDAMLSSEEAARRKERDGFYAWLKYQGYWLKAMSLVDRGDGVTKEKGLDASITKDLERLSHSRVANTIVLVSGDADYQELVSEVQALYGIKVEVAFFQEYTAKTLQVAATQFIDLTKVKDALRRVA